MKRRYVYHLEVTYPPGSDEPEWEPSCWHDKDSTFGLPLHHGPFRWPRVRDYLTEGGAQGRAYLLSKYGATVTIVRGVVTEWQPVACVSEKNFEWLNQQSVLTS